MHRHDWSKPKRAHVTPLFISHWCLYIEQPHAQHLLTSTHLWQSTSPQEVWDLRASVASWCHHREAQNPSPERFHSPFLAGGMNPPPPPPPTQNAESLTIFKRHLETHLFCLHLTSYKKKKPSLSFLNFSLFPLTSHCLVRICFEQCLEICITSASCVCLPLYNVSLIVFLNCKSLWIKASAKWINVNVTSRCFYRQHSTGNYSKILKSILSKLSTP